tara:strand:- start:1621 stop:2346 length:726 start_codon:yes stop_codon:yes gene_type:complete
MSYFQKFPLIYAEGSESLEVSTNIMKRVGIKKTVIDSLIEYQQNYNSDKSRPEILAYNTLGSSELHWVLMHINNVIDPYHDWIMTDSQFQAHLNEKYPNQYLFIATPDPEEHLIVGETYSGLISDNLQEFEVVDFMPLPNNNSPTSPPLSQVIVKVDVDIVALNGTIGENSIIAANPWLPTSTGKELNAIRSVVPKTKDGNYSVITNLEYEVSLHDSKISTSMVSESSATQLSDILGEIIK